MEKNVRRAILEWRYQAKPLTELIESICAFGKLP